VLRAAATRLPAAHAALAPRITRELLEEVSRLVPVDWLGGARAEAYVEHLRARAPEVPGVIQR
jgi:hypothetical protein